MPCHAAKCNKVITVSRGDTVESVMKAMKKAKHLFQEGEETVAEHHRRLFLNFEKQIEGRAQAIEHWIDLIEFAQKKRLQELKEAKEEQAKQPRIHEFFTVLPKNGSILL